MTKAQKVRQRFKSSLPRKIGDASLSPMEAFLRTMSLVLAFHKELEADGLDGETIRAALVYCEPDAKGKEHLLAETLEVPKPGKVGEFGTRVLAMDKAVFLGMLFLQHDKDAKDEKQKDVIFGCEFTKAHDAEARLLAARRQIATGRWKRAVN